MSKRTFTDEQIVKILEKGERTEESKSRVLSPTWNQRIGLLLLEKAVSGDAGQSRDCRSAPRIERRNPD